MHRHMCVYINTLHPTYMVLLEVAFLNRPVYRNQPTLGLSLNCSGQPTCVSVHEHVLCVFPIGTICTHTYRHLRWYIYIYIYIYSVYKLLSKINQLMKQEPGATHQPHPRRRPAWRSRPKEVEWDTQGGTGPIDLLFLRGLYTWYRVCICVHLYRQCRRWPVNKSKLSILI